MAETILLVDDDRQFREEFAEALSDYRLIQASSGAQALEILRRPHEIDLVILDVMMPGLSGTDVLRRIKQIAPELRIVILTGYSSKDVAIEALKGHADDYLEKPFDLARVLAVIERLLEDRRGRAGSVAGGIPGKIEKAKRFADRNCCKKITLADVAQAVCLSPKYFSRLFQQRAGMGFTEYRLQAKIKKSRELLERTSLNIDEISRSLGYENTESFIRQFKKICRVTPTRYRKDHCRRRKSR